MRRHLTNVASLYGLQIATLVLPLVLLPFLTRRLGPDVWGVLAVQSSLSVLMAVVLEFGFGFGATRQAAAVRDDRRALGTIVSDLLVARAQIAVAVAAVWVLVWFAVPLVQQEPVAYVFTYFLTLAQGFSPAWFFQAVGRLPFVLTRDLAARVSSTVIIVIIVHDPSQAWLVPAVQFASLAVSTVITNNTMLREVERGRFSVARGLVMLRENVHLCLNRLVLVIAPMGNTFLLGALSPGSVAVYAAAERTAGATRSLLSPVSQVAFPEIVLLFGADPVRAKVVVRRILVGLVLGSAVMAGVLWFLADVIVAILFGSAFAETAGVFRILLVSVPLFAIVQVLGLQWLLPLRHDRAFFISTVLGAITNIALAAALAPAYGAMGMAWALLASETALVVGILIYTEFVGPSYLRILRR